MVDPQRFERLVCDYQDMVFTVAFRLVGQRAEAEDIAQTVFIKAYEHFAMLEAIESPGGWLRTVTRNLALNHLTRYRARWRMFSEMGNKDSDEDYAAQVPAPHSKRSPLDAAERAALVESALGALPEAQRISLVLFYFHNMSGEEIAERLNISLAKVKTDMHRGRETLRKRLRPLLDDIN
jgi:RNA polymerase sigma-70 factor (ECF subfamily)